MKQLKKATTQTDKPKRIGKAIGATSPAKKQPAKPRAPQSSALRQRPNSKLGIVIGMLRGTKGTTIEALSKATGWQTHSVRGAISGAIKNKLGLTVTSTKADGVRTYRINN